MIILLSTIVSLLLFSECTGQNYILEINQGTLSGSVGYDRKGGVFYSFVSIPYGKPPIGDLRFKEPQPADSWNGIRDASIEMPVCFQLINLINLPESEDCLYLNVYTPQFPSDNYDTLKDVMVFIHGGAFIIGAGRQENFGAEFLMTEDIVLVTINYRLGIFGAFHLDDDSLDYHGNLNMMDQILALKWVQSNIARFGGNPDSVTIVGQSAGAASVHLHVVSPLSAGLFHRAIIESGTATAPWAIGFPNNAILLAQALNIPTSDTAEMLRRFHDLSAGEIVIGQFILNSLLPQWGFLGCPIVQKQTENRTVFLPDKPMSLIKRGAFNQVPLIIGFNNIDGAGFTSLFTEIINLVLSGLEIEADTQEAADLIEKIDNFYAAPGLFDAPMVQMHTDIWFGYPPYRAAKEQLKTANNSIYFYTFSADTALNLYKAADASFSQYPGAVHADELCYILNSTDHNRITIEPGSVEEKAIDRVVELWANFVKYGNPTPENFTSVKWMSIVNDVFNYVDIGTSETIAGVNPNEISMRFWDSIYDNYSLK